MAALLTLDWFLLFGCIEYLCIKNSLIYFWRHIERDYSKNYSTLLNTSNSLTQYQFEDALEILNLNLTSDKQGIHLNPPESPWRENSNFFVHEKVYFIYC